jgi:hypothetical protein
MVEIEGAIGHQFQSLSIIFVCAVNTKLASLWATRFQIYMELIGLTLSLQAVVVVWYSKPLFPKNSRFCDQNVHFVIQIPIAVITLTGFYWLRAWEIPHAHWNWLRDVHASRTRVALLLCSYSVAQWLHISVIYACALISGADWPMHGHELKY